MASSKACFFDSVDNAVFICSAPTYAKGYERIYKHFEEVFTWDSPNYQVLDDDRRQALLDWMKAHNYVWYSDYPIEGMTPVLEQKGGRFKTVYLYSNLIRKSAYMITDASKPLPLWRILSEKDTIEKTSTVKLVKITTSQLALFKEIYLAKAIVFCPGMWAYAVVIDGKVAGFLEFTRSTFNRRGEVYLNSDFCIADTRYKRLSKLISMLAISAGTKKLIERDAQVRMDHILTTAFTEKPVSMKYRGVLKLMKRGVSKEGKAFINYGGEFSTLGWQETLAQWISKQDQTNS